VKEHLASFAEQAGQQISLTDSAARRKNNAVSPFQSLSQCPAQRFFFVGHDFHRQRFAAVPLRQSGDGVGVGVVNLPDAKGRARSGDFVACRQDSDARFGVNAGMVKP